MGVFCAGAEVSNIESEVQGGSKNIGLNQSDSPAYESAPEELAEGLEKRSESARSLLIRNDQRPKTRTRGKNQPQPPAGRKYPSVVALVDKQQKGREPGQTEDQKVLIRSSRQGIRQERQREEQSPVRQLATEDFPTGSQADANMAQPSGSSSEGKRKRMDSSSLRKKSKSDS